MITETAVHHLSATELLDLYRRKALSPVEVTKAVLDRIAHWEPSLRASYALDPEGALAQARQAEARWSRGAPAGALDGVPLMIKENIATQGVAVPLGTAATELTPAAADAPPAARLREAGAVFLGKTTMPDLGMLSSGLSSFHPLTRNPWNLDLNPGGSSAGAGAGAAAGYGPLHLGTDIGGSVRLPAGWCGIFALKPSLGRIPIDPPYIGRVAGPMTRTVADAALMMEVLSLPDERDHMSLPPQTIDWRNLDREVRGLKLGLLLDAGSGAAGRAGGEGRNRGSGAALQGSRRPYRAHEALPDPRDARGPRPLLAHPGPGGYEQMVARTTGQGAALHPRLGGRSRGCLRHGCLSRLQPGHGHARGHQCRLPAL